MQLNNKRFMSSIVSEEIFVVTLCTLFLLETNNFLKKVKLYSIFLDFFYFYQTQQSILAPFDSQVRCHLTVTLSLLCFISLGIDKKTTITHLVW
jgi:hypothetical protein